MSSNSDLCRHPPRAGLRRLLPGVLAFGLGAALAPQASAAGEPAQSWLVAPSFFGMHFHHVFAPPAGKARTVIPNGPAAGWRLHDMRVRWAELQPARGQWNFETLDAAVALAQEKGLEPMLVLGSTPKWASARPEEKCPYGMGCAAEPADIADWETYVRTVATRYRGRIRLYEVWNEPKFSDVKQSRNSSFFTGSTQAMLDLAKVAYRVLKEVDAANQLASPGFTVHTAQLEHYMEAGGGAYADAVAFHFYVPTPEDMPERIGKVRNIMKNAGLADKPLWNTEQYFELLPAGVKAPGPGGHGVSDAGVMSAYTQRSHILAAANGVNRMYWYGFELSMVNPDGTPSEVATGYATVARWLTGSRVGPCVKSAPDLYACTLKRGSEQAYAVWRTGGSGAFRPPAEWGSSNVESPAGVTGELSDGQASIGPAPVLFKPSRQPWGGVAKPAVAASSGERARTAVRQ